MITLNLTANGKEQELIKAYLEEHASEALANKINNGTRIEKDGKTLINKKTLDGFMKFANEEARKIAEKGARAACVQDSVVYGWAIHYFEEESIEEALFTEDGEPYKAPKPKAIVKSPVSAPVAPTKKKEANDQMTFFDFIEDDDTSTTTDSQEEEEVVEETEVIVENKPQISPMYQQYIAYTEQYPTPLSAMRVGDFYELFGNAAVMVAEKLEMTLVSRDFGLENKIPMVGFPYHAKEIYRNKIREFSAVAIIDDADHMHFYLKKEKDGPDMSVNTETGEVIEQKSNNVDDLIGILFGILKNDVEVRIK